MPKMCFYTINYTKPELWTGIHYFNLSPCEHAGGKTSLILTDSGNNLFWILIMNKGQSSLRNLPYSCKQVCFYHSKNTAWNETKHSMYHKANDIISSNYFMFLYYYILSFPLPASSNLEHLERFLELSFLEKTNKQTNT